MERYYSYSRFIKEYFGKKLYKICIDGGFTCPNRDGTLATGGCIFCSEGGSGEFTENASLSVSYPFHILTMEEYINHLIICLSQLRKDIVIERMTGDGPKDLLIVPKWIGHKRPVLNTIHKEMKQRNFTQGGSLCQKNL